MFVCTRFWRSCVIFCAFVVRRDITVGGPCTAQISVCPQLFCFVTMAPKAQFRRVPDAARVASQRPKVNLAKHFLTHGIRPTMTKDMSFTHKNEDLKSFVQFSQGLNAETAVLLASPGVGMSQHAQLLNSGEETLKPYIDSKILGETVNQYIHQMSKMRAQFEVIDSACTTGAPKTEENIHSAMIDIYDQFNTMHNRRTWQHLCEEFRQVGVRLLHHAQALQEVMHFCGEDPVTIARAIPPNQPGPDVLKDVTSLNVGSSRGKARLLTWLSVALQEKNSHWAEQSTRPASARVDYSNLNDENSEDDPQERVPQRQPRSLSRSRTPPRAAPKRSAVKAKAKASVAPVTPASEASRTPSPVHRRTRQALASSSRVQRVTSHSRSRSRTPVPTRATASTRSATVVPEDTIATRSTRKRQSLRNSETVVPHLSIARKSERQQQSGTEPGGQDAVLAMLSTLVSRIDAIEKRSTPEDTGAGVGAFSASRTNEPPPTQPSQPVAEEHLEETDEVKSEKVQPKRRSLKPNASQVSTGSRRRHITFDEGSDD